jgi:hypothetical protein
MDAIEDMRARKAAPDYTPPAADLGYCTCGTVWNIEAMAQQKFVRGTCPDCGEHAVEIETARRPKLDDDEKCPIHGIAECMCDDPAEWRDYVSR